MICFVLTPRCFAYRHAASTFYQLQKGFGGRRQHARIQEFLPVLFSPQFFYSLQRGSDGFIAEKTILILYQGSRGRGFIIFQGGGPTFSRGGGGVRMPISIETHKRTCYFPGGCQDPYPPLDPHTSNVIITETIFIIVPLLTIIVRH